MKIKLLAWVTSSWQPRLPGACEGGFGTTARALGLHRWGFAQVCAQREDYSNSINVTGLMDNGAEGGALKGLMTSVGRVEFYWKSSQFSKSRAGKIRVAPNR